MNHSADRSCVRIRLARLMVAMPLMACGMAARAQIDRATDPAVPAINAAERASATQPLRARTDAGPPRAKPLDLGPRVIRQAIADTNESNDRLPIANAGRFGNVTTTHQQRIDQQFEDAAIPTCMTTDAWKFDPPHIGPIPIPGIFAAPWLVHAIATGRCRH